MPPASSATAPTAAQQGAAADRLQLRSFLTSLSAAGELGRSIAARNFYEVDTIRWRTTMKIFWICAPLFLAGCHQDSPRKSDVIIPSEEKFFSDLLRKQMVSRNFSSLNKYVGKYELCDAQGRLVTFQDFLGIEIRPDGTYSREPGKGGWNGKYSIKNNILFLHGYSWRRRTARAKLSGKFLTVYDKSEYRGSLRLVKTWPIKGIHYNSPVIIGG